MDAETAGGPIQDATGTRAVPIPQRRLWLGIGLAPAAWTVGFAAGYVLVARSCEGDNGMHATGVAGVRWVDLGIAIVTAAVALLGLLIAVGDLRAARRTPATSDLQTEIAAGAADPEARGRVPWWGRELFMARAGVIGSAIFLGGTMLFLWPPIVLDICNQAH